MAQPSKRVAVLFHIADFNDGGIESSLMQWLRILRPRALFGNAVLDVFVTRVRAALQRAGSRGCLHGDPHRQTLQTRRYAHRLSKLGRIGRDVFNTLAVRPYVKARVAALAQRHDIIIDFDMSLGRFGMAGLGVNHFSFDARPGDRRRKMKRLLAQYAMTALPR